MALQYNMAFTPALNTSAPPATAGSDNAAQAFGRAAVHSAIPTAGGLAGAAAGAEAGAVAGAFGGPLDEITIPGGAIVGGVLGAFGAGNVTSYAQDQALAAVPDFATAIGQSPEQLAESATAHPIAAFAGELAPQAAFLHPSSGVITDLLKLGSKESGVALGKIALGAGIQGGLEAGQEYANTGEVDPLKVAIASGVGGILHEEGPLGRAVGNTARGVTSDILPADRAARVADYYGRGDTAPAGTGSDVGDAIKSNTSTDLLQITDQRGSDGRPINSDNGPIDTNPQPIAVDSSGNAVADPSAITPVSSEYLAQRRAVQATQTPGFQPEMFPDAPVQAPPAPAAPPPITTEPPGVGPVTDVPPPRPETQPGLFDSNQAALVNTDQDFSHGAVLQSLREANPKPDGSAGPADTFTLKLANQVANAIQAGDVRAAHDYITQARTDLEASPISQKAIVARTNMLDAGKATLDAFQSKRVNAFAADGVAKALDSGQQPAVVAAAGPPVDPNTSANIIREANLSPSAPPVTRPDDVNATIDASNQAAAAARRRELLQGVLDDPTTRNPTGRFINTLRQNGHSDLGVRPEEAATIAKFEDARDAFNRAPETAEPAPTEATPADTQPAAEPEDWRAARDQALEQEYGQAPETSEGGAGEQSAPAERPAEGGPALDATAGGGTGPDAATQLHAAGGDATREPAGSPGAGAEERVAPRDAYAGLRDKILDAHKNGMIDAKQLNRLNLLHEQRILSGNDLRDTINAAIKDHLDSKLSKAFGPLREKIEAKRAAAAQIAKVDTARAQAEKQVVDTGAVHDQPVAMFDPPSGPPRLARATDTEAGNQTQHDVTSRDIQEALRKVGLEGRVGATLVDNLTSRGTPVSGHYHDLLISVAKHVPGDPLETFHHETIHALRDLDLIRPDEWNRLVDYSRRNNRDVAAFVEKHYSALPQAARDEELVAETFARHVTDSEAPKNIIQAVMAKVQKFFDALSSWARGKGLTTGRDIFESIRSGEVGSRPWDGTRAGNYRDNVTQGAAEPVARAIKDPVEAADETAKKTPSDVITAMGGTGRRAVLNFLTQRQIAEDFGHTALKPQLDRWVDNLATTVAKKDSYVHDASHASADWSALPESAQKDVGKLLQDGTLTQKDATQKSSGDLYDRYKALSPEAQAVHDAVIDTFRQQSAQTLKLLAAKINSAEDSTLSAAEKAQAIRELEGKFKRLSIYFPLQRFGDFINVGRTAEYAAAESHAQAMGDRLTAMAADPKTASGDLAVAQENHDEAQRQLTNAQATGYMVTAHEKESDQLAMRRQMEAQGMKVAQKKATDFDARTDTISTGFMGAINKALDAEVATDPGHAEAVKGMRSMINQLYFSMMPEGSALKNNLSRKNVAGFDPNAQRAYAATAIKNAGFLAALEHGELSRQILAEMKKTVDAADNGKEMGDVYNQVKKHYNILGQYADTPIQNFLANSTYAYMLGATPAFTFMHLMQTPLTTFPMLAAHFNAVRSGGALVKAFAEVSTHLGDLKANDQAFGKTDGEKQAIAYALGHNIIAGTHADQFLAKSTNQSAIGKVGDRVMKVAGFMPHYTEKLNRMATYLAAYRMAIESPATVQRVGRGLTDAQHQQIMADNPALAGTSRAQMEAQRYAERITLDSHIDYSRENAPYVFQAGAVKFFPSKLVFQFQKYQQGMVHTLAKSAMDSFDKNLTGAERVAAVKTLAGVVGTHGLLTGAMGLPAYGLMAFIANAYHKVLGDKDKPFNADDSFRSMLDQALGKDAGDVVARGLFYTPGLRSVLPGDVTDRIGMGDLLTPTSETGDIDRDNVMQYIGTALGGPAASLIGQFADVYKEHHQGDDWKAMELVMPKVMRDIARATRFYQDGVTTSSNNPVVAPGDLKFTDILAQGIGFTPQTVESAYANRAAVMDAKTELDARRKILLKEYTDAAAADDNDRMSALRDKIDNYNQAQRDAGIYSETIKGSEMMRSVMDRRLAGIRLKNGVALSPKQRALIDTYADQPST